MQRTPRWSLGRSLASLLWMLPIAGVVAASEWPPAVEHALVVAGENRGELERVLEHYRDDEDPLKLEAAQFLVANMEGHGYIVHTFHDEEGREVEFDALRYPSYREAQAAFEALEREHGSLDYGRKRFDPDLEVVTASFLIEDIDLAFAAWRENPWAADISFEVFCEYILPYRGSNEPLDPWRRTCMDRLADVLSELDDPRDLEEAGNRVGRAAAGWVRFDELYYLHPTDQGFREMLESGRGRCEDGSNMQSYAYRAAAVLAATDYTPHWADRDNNHAWPVRLDAEGRGRAGLAHRAAKVYRKMFSVQPDSLGAIKHEDEEVPRWLSRRTYRDVTDQYMETTDVTVRLTASRPDSTRFAYLCVFNAGAWKAIHWARVDETGAAAFTDMGRDIAYLPALYVDGAIVPAGPPLILTREGHVRPLDGASDGIFQLEIATAAPEEPVEIGAPPTFLVEPDREYELFVWEGGWVSMGRRTLAGGSPRSTSRVSVPSDRLFWLVAVDGPPTRLERIFTVEGDALIRW